MSVHVGCSRLDMPRCISEKQSRREKKMGTLHEIVKPKKQVPGKILNIFLTSTRGIAQFATEYLCEGLNIP